MASGTRELERDNAHAPSRASGHTADRALANALPQIIWTCDADGRLEWVNDHWFELTGLSETETLNDKGALSAVHPDDRAELTTRWERALRTSLSTEVEYRVRNSRGEFRWHIGRISPVRDAEDAVTGWVAAAFDVHDRRAAEDAMRASERKFETFFDLSPQPLAITRRSDGVFLNANDALVDLVGFTRDELIGRSSIELRMVTAGERAAFIAPLTNGPHRAVQNSLRVKDGRVIQIMVSCAPIEIDGVACLVNALTDVTDRLAAEDALRKSEAEARARADELAALMDAVPAVVWVAHDPYCREIEGNRTGYEALRIPIGQNLSKTAADPTPTRHFSVFTNGVEIPPDQLVLQRAARGGEFRNYEEELRFDDGRVTHLYGNVIPLRDPDGKPRGAVGAFVDVTRLKQAEEALRQADRRKDEFLALLSHELRNPLTPILTSARLLERSVDSDGLRELDVIVRQVKHLVRLVDDLLDVSRVARGTVTLSPTRLELSTIVARAVEATAPLFEKRDHRLEVSIPSEGLAIDGDEVRLTQVLDNLLTNAARYTAPGGVVSVMGAREGDSVVVRVRDTGVGIDPALVPEVFDVFVQGNRGPDRAPGGLGIGLSLVRRLTELHGGTVTAHSDGVGHGSEFVVRLPAAMGLQNPLAQPSDPRPTVSGSAARSARVLLVDDHPDVVNGLSRLLKVIGFDVRAASNATEGIALAETFRPEIAILDIGLPVMDGYALARELRARLRDAAPVLIALSGYSQTEDKARSEEAGFALHLVKPIDIDEFVNVLGVYADGRAKPNVMKQ